MSGPACRIIALLAMAASLLPGAVLAQVPTGQSEQPSIVSPNVPPAAAAQTLTAPQTQVQDERCRSGTESVGFKPTLPRTRQRLAAGEPLTIVALGSSTTAGSGASGQDASYPAVLEEMLTERLPHLKVRVVNQGIGGQRTEDMVNRITEVLAETPLIVIWQTGVNDAIREVGVEVMRKYLKKGFARMEAANIDVIFMGAQWLPRPERYPQYDSYRVAMNEMAAQNNVPLFRRYDVMVGWNRAGRLSQGDILGVDGLHMVDASYRCLALLVTDGIVQALKPSTANR